MFHYKNGTTSNVDLRYFKEYASFKLHNLNGPANDSPHGDYYWIDGEYIGYNLSKEIFDKHVMNYLKKVVFE